MRYRSGEQDDWYERDVKIMGKVARVDEDIVSIVQGPSMTAKAYFDDLAAIFNDDADFTLALLADAALNGDVVTVELTKHAISYLNPTQMKRFEDDETLELVSAPA